MVPCTPDNLIFLLVFEEFYLHVSPCQRMLDVSRGQTTTESAAPMQAEARGCYPQRALTTLLQLFKERLILSKEKTRGE